MKYHVVTQSLGPRADRDHVVHPPAQTLDAANLDDLALQLELDGHSAWDWRTGSQDGQSMDVTLIHEVHAGGSLGRRVL